MMSQSVSWEPAEGASERHENKDEWTDKERRLKKGKGGGNLTVRGLEVK